jgi:lipid-A-disaccharide synthase-like uncharacterized protein
VQRVTSLSKNIRLCSCVLILFLQSESYEKGSIPQPFAWFPILDGATVQYQYSKQDNVFVAANSWKHGAVFTLQRLLTNQPDTPLVPPADDTKWRDQNRSFA